MASSASPAPARSSALRAFQSTIRNSQSAIGALGGFRLTGEGVLWLMTAALLVGIGVFKNIDLLTTLGYVMLVLIALNAMVAGRRLRRLEARRQVGELIFAGTGCKVEVRVRNLDQRPRVGVRVEDTGPDHTLGWYLDHIEGCASRACRGEVVLPRRGWYCFGRLLATSGYPFGLVRRRVVLREDMRVLVLPRPGKLVRERLRHQLRGVDPHGERVRRRGWRDESAQAEVHGLRAFRPGDSPRLIHWRTSARRGELMVREMEDVPGDDLVLVLDTAAPAEESFEEAVRLAATVVWEWCRRRGDRLTLAIPEGDNWKIHDGVSGPEHALSLLQCLAEVSMSPFNHPEQGHVEELSRAVPRTASVVIVSAGSTCLPTVLEPRVGRPVALLDVTRWKEWGFYHP
jgi:uncharacterized protein (DUF58 family)